MVLAGALLATLVQLAPVLFLGRPIGVADIWNQYVPWYQEPARPPANALLDDAATGLAPWMTALGKHGELLATPSQAAGAAGPLTALFGVLSPAVLAPYLLPRALALTGMAVLDLTISFLLFFLWRRARGDGLLASGLGAAIWAWAPARTVWRTWPHAGLTWTLPLLLLLAEHLVSSRSLGTRPRVDRSALAWCAAGLLLVLGGHPAFAAMGLYMATAWGVARAVSGPKLPAARDLLSPALGLGLAALSVAPCLALGATFLADGEWRELRAPIRDSAPVSWRLLMLLFHPGWFGSPTSGTWRGLGWTGPDNMVELQLYLGLAPLLLAPLAVLSRRREAVFFAGLAAASLLAFTAGGPLAWLARALPGLDLVFLPRLKLVFLFAVASLAAIGVSVLARLRLPRITIPALFVFTTLDLSLATQRFDPFPGTSDRPPPSTPGLSRLRELAPGDGKRFLALGTALPPNLAFALDLEDVRAHLLFSAGYRRFVSRLDPGAFGRHGTSLIFEAPSFRPDAWALDLLGVSALLAPPGSPHPGGDLALAYRGPDADVYARAWKPPVAVVPREGPETRVGTVESFEASRTRWRAVVVAPSNARVLFGRSRLRLTDRVLVNGSAARCLSDPRAEGLLAIDVPPGRHELVVRPSLSPFLLAPSALGLAGFLVLCALSLRSGARSGSPR